MGLDARDGKQCLGGSANVNTVMVGVGSITQRKGNEVMRLVLGHGREEWREARRGNDVLKRSVVVDGFL